MLEYTSPGYRIILTVALSMTIGFVAVLIGQSIAGSIWEFDLTNPSAEYDVMDPDYAMAQRVVMLFAHLGMFIFSAWAAAWLFSKNPVRMELGLQMPKKTMVFLLLPLLMVALFPSINYLYELNLQWNAPEEVLQMEDQSQSITKSFLNTESLGVLGLNLLVLALIPAIGEELLFRGLIQKYSILWLKNPHAGIWMAAFIFSFVHFQFLGFLPRLVLGAYFGYLAVWTGSLLPSMGLHFLNNATAVVLSFLVRNNDLPEEIEFFGAGDETMLLVSMVGISALTFAIYRLGRK